MLDYKIYRLARKSNYPKSRDMNEKIDDLLNDIVSEESHNARKRFYMKKRVAVAFSVIMLIGLVSLPVRATIDYVQKRMEQISDSEQEKIYDEQQDAEGEEAIEYSRLFSEQEQQRYDELWQQYENEGILPSSQLITVESWEGEVNYPVYLTKNRELLLPERELKDDELLQIIDYYHIADYSVRNINKNVEEDISKNQLISDVSVEDAVRNKAILYLDNLEKIEYEQYTMDVVYSPGDGVYEDMYVVNFVLDELSEYEICISAKNEKLISISCNNENKDYYAESAKVTDELLESLRNETKELCQLYFESPIEEQSFLEYKATEDGQSSSGNISVYCALSNGDAYCFKYNIPQGEFWYIYYMQDLEQYKEMQQSKNTDYDEEKGITLKQIPF